MNEAARNVDMHTCPAPMESGTGTHVGGNLIVKGNRTVIINGAMAIVMGDQCTCPGSPNAVAKGSSSVIIDGMPAARMLDKTLHAGQIASGSPNVFIGN